ncbi:hypothetical protein, partial [Pseudomonas gessardii]|uniref:hypothetical protein n=1 Tax=Pseudomonas gessardii TaxID=78544 RepID=UPI001CA4259B
MYIDTRRKNPNDSVCLKGTMTAKITIGGTSEPDFVADYVWYGNLQNSVHLYGDRGRRQKLSATPDLSGTVLPLCPIPNSALKNAPPFKSAMPKASA